MAPLLAVFLVLTAPDVWADQPPPTDPPEARAQPPVGVTSQARAQPPVGIAPPPPEPQAPMTLTDMILMWLQFRISLPNA